MQEIVLSPLQFYLNDQLISPSGGRASDTLLDFIRLRARLTGTKEGCAEGDCGACTVLVGRLHGGKLSYRAVNACITLLASVAGCHVVTVEALSAPGRPLHPVQQAMLDHHGSQCGFCTPGFVMSLYALWLTNPHPSEAEIDKALQGNLCRCTGYAPIVAAAKAMANLGAASDNILVRKQARMAVKLMVIGDVGRCGFQSEDGDLAVLPADLDDLAELYAEHPGATLVAGATDVGLWVTKMMKPISPVIFVHHLAALKKIQVSEEAIIFGASVTYSEAYPSIIKYLPQLAPLWDRIGGEQVRGVGTIGGNIANGSPIGDTPPPLIALGAELTLRRGREERTIMLEDFFLEYGRQDREPGEFVLSVTVPLPSSEAKFAAYKISKRRDEDISALCGAFLLCLDANNRVETVTIAFGGMAGTPKRARACEAALRGEAWCEETVTRARLALAEDFAPLSDWRASADYRMKVAQNLLTRFFLETSRVDIPLRLQPDLREGGRDERSQPIP